MAEKLLYECEQCNKNTLDYYAEEGWVIVEGSVTLTHKRMNRNAVTGYLHPSARSFFCSLKCFSKYLKRIKPDGTLRKMEGK